MRVDTPELAVGKTVRWLPLVLTISAVLVATVAFRGKVSMLRTSADLSFADLKQYPTVLIGAFSNRWTFRQLRFFSTRTRARKFATDSGLEWLGKWNGIATGGSL